VISAEDFVFDNHSSIPSQISSNRWHREGSLNETDTVRQKKSHFSYNIDSSNNVNKARRYKVKARFNKDKGLDAKTKI